MITQDFIYAALRRCGQIRPGYTPSPELMNDALVEWQVWYDGLNAERTMNYTTPDYIYPITGPGHALLPSGQSLGAGLGYEIGPTAADFVGPRPERIIQMNLYMTSASPSEPTRIGMRQLSAEEYFNIIVLAIPPINIATVFYYEARYPNGVIWVWPPLNGNSLEILTWGSLTPPANLTDVYAAPPGYADLIIYRLAQRLYNLCTKEVLAHRVSLQWLVGQAEICAARVRAVNAPSPRLINDFQNQSVSAGSGDLTLLLTGVPF